MPSPPPGHGSLCITASAPREPCLAPSLSPSHLATAPTPPTSLTSRLLTPLPSPPPRPQRLSCPTPALAAQDLDDPLSGIYTFRAALDERTTYLESLLRELETMPSDYVPQTVSATGL